jgi:release factor glutamine methyltransferase
VEVQTYLEFLTTFFNSERKNLTLNYPGLTFRRLCDETPVHDLSSIFLKSKSDAFNAFIEKVKLGIPLEYISGSSYFYRSRFVVNENVLIPRSETEILVELAVQEVMLNYKNKLCRVLDVCTGSGAIGLSLLREGAAEFDMTLSDLSRDALNIAKTNYFQMQFLFPTNHKIQFIETDRLNGLSGKYNIILSNPPYIKKIIDRENVHSQVLKYEPELALFLKDEEYDKWFIKFFSDISEHLELNGVAIVEGHENHLESLKESAIQLGFSSASVITDYNQRNRFLRLRKQNG